MTYKFNKDLPEIVQNHLPERAQDIFREEYNAAWEKHQNRKLKPDETIEEISYKAAWAKVKTKYMQKNEKWILKD